MINREYAFTIAGLQGVAAILCADSYPVLSMIFLTGVVLQLNLVNVFRANEVKIRVKDLFEDNYSVNQFKAQFKDDPKFAESLSYISSLPPDDFIAFSRLMIEVRYQHDQVAMKAISRQFRLEKK